MRSTEIMAVVSRAEFPALDAAKREAVRFALAGVRHAASARVIGVRDTRWPERRWYLTVAVFLKEPHCITQD